MTEQENRSFHITCVPGRALMWKRLPTKRKFSFHLSKLDKSEKLSQENSISSRENSQLPRENSILFKENISTDGKKISTATNGNSKTRKENVLKCSNKLSLKRISSIQMTSEIKAKQKTSALKDIGNILRVPGLGSAAHKNFETPARVLPPTIRRLVNVFVPSDKKRNNSSSLSEFSQKETSNMVHLNQTQPSIYDFTDHEAEMDDNKKDILPEATIDVISNSGMAAAIPDVVTEETKVKDQLDKERIDYSKTVNLNDSKNLSLLPDLSDSFACMSTIEKRETELQSKDKNKSDGNEKTATEIVLDKSVLLTRSNLRYSATVDSSGDQNDAESLIHQPATLAERNAAEKKIINTPMRNDLSQIKRRRTTVCHSNIHPSSANVISHLSINAPNPQILLLSPVHNASKNLISNCNTQSYTHNTLDMSDVFSKKGAPEKDKDLQENASSGSTAHSVVSKQNSARRKINLQKSTGIIVHQTRALFQEKTNEKDTTIEPPKRYYLPQEIVQLLKIRKMKRNLNFEILSNDKPDFILAPKIKKKYMKKPQKQFGDTLPAKVKVLMYRKASFKRKVADITDLEIIFGILNSNYGEETDATEAEKILKTYQKYVIKDVANLINDSVELQAKRKEIKKLYREIELKGKQLGTLIDERNKIYHRIANGELHIVD